MTPTKMPLFVFVDGADMDIALGSVLGRKPQSLERPRWGKALEYARKEWPDRHVQGVFFIRKPELPSKPLNRFIDAVKATGFMVDQSADVKWKIAEILRALAKGGDDVILLSHQDYTEELTSLIDGRRIVGVVVFPEQLGEGIEDEYEDGGIKIIDFETDVKAFDRPLPRQKESETSPAALLDMLRGNA